MADLDESAQDSLLDAALHTTKDDDAVLGDITGDSAVDDTLEDPVIIPFKYYWPLFTLNQEGTFCLSLYKHANYLIN